MRNQHRTTIAALIALVGGLIFLGLLTWGNYRFAQDNPGGNDFLVHYIATRALIMEGLNPYSDEVAQEIQTAAYGRPAREGEKELRVAYPLYSIIVFLPFTLIGEYTMARAIWMSIRPTTAYICHQVSFSPRRTGHQRFQSVIMAVQ